jgi:gingipain R
MRRFSILVLIGLISVVTHGYWMPFDPGTGYGSPVVESVDMMQNDTIFTLKIPGMSVESEQNEHGDFSRLELPGHGWLMETGSPQIPAIRKNIIVPVGAVIDLEVDVYSVVEYGNFDIWPAQPSYKRSEQEPPFTINSEIYDENAFFPVQWARVSNDAHLRDFRYVTVDLYPVRVNPVTGELMAAREMIVRVISDEKEWSYPEAVFPSFHSIYQNNFVNFDLLDLGQRTTPEPMLIICHDAFISNMSSFIEWKTKRGIDVTLVSSTVTGTSSSAIYSYIQNVWSTWNPKPVYIILVGDAPQLQPLSGIGYCASDSKFTLLEGGDKVPDVFISRLSAGNTTDLNAQLDKILEYEVSPPEGYGGWLDSFSGLASNEGWNPSDEEYSREIEARFFARNSDADADRIYQRLGHGATQIRNAVNQGRFWLSYFGHGSGTSWSAPSFTNTNVNALTNGSYTPFIMDVSCSNGYFNGSSDCFAERWMKNSGKGAVGIYSSSTVTAWHEPARLAWGVTYSVTGNSNGSIPGGNYILGQMALDGILYMYSIYGTGSNTEEVMNQYVLFGDCSLMFRFDATSTLSVIHPGTISTGPGTFSVSVSSNLSPVENAVVSLYKDDDIHDVSLTDSDGVADLEISPATSGVMIVTVSGKNLEPHESLVTVSSAPPNTPTPTAIPTHTPTPNPTQHPDCRNTGDVNTDGDITATDAQLTFLIALGIKIPTEDEACAADCNGDGLLTAADAQSIFLTVLGMGSCADPL